MPARSLAIIVLTKNEELNLPDLLASLEGLDADLFVVDSGSTDRTVDIALAAGCSVVEHPFVHYAAQRNWSLDHLPIETPWTLCLDADERLTQELRNEIARLVASPTPEFDGYMLRKRTMFMGRWLRHGGQYPSWHLRLFRTGTGRCEDRLYDQHFVVAGRVSQCRHDYIDILTDSLDNWTERHNRWASLEAAEQLAGDATGRIRPKITGNPIERKRFLRLAFYGRAPLLLRPFFLFLFDYIVRLGFLDGRPGLIFHVLQRFWFRFLVDAKIYEMKAKTLEPPSPAQGHQVEFDRETRHLLYATRER